MWKLKVSHKVASLHLLLLDPLIQSLKETSSSIGLLQGNMKKREFLDPVLYKEELQITSSCSNMIDQPLHLLRQYLDSKIKCLKHWEMTWVQGTTLQTRILICHLIRKIKLINYILEGKEIRHFHNCQDGGMLMILRKISE